MQIKFNFVNYIKNTVKTGDVYICKVIQIKKSDSRTIHFKHLQVSVINIEQKYHACCMGAPLNIHFILLFFVNVAATDTHVSENSLTIMVYEIQHMTGGRTTKSQ